MARAYVGYKEHIEELEEDESDQPLLKNHMNNLLNAIKVNSSDFLSNEGDKHPFWDSVAGRSKIKETIKKEIDES